MADVLRSCSKTACRWPAAASLSYRYATRQVWLLDLAPAPDPSLYDLCPHHADYLVVPKGWERVDDRSVEQVMVEPSAFDRAEQARRQSAAAATPSEAASAPRPVARPGQQGNRYAALAEQLPRLAAEAGVGAAASIRSGPLPQEAAAHIEASVRAHAEASARADADPPPSPEPVVPAAPVRRVQHARSAPPVPSRDLAPLPPAGTWEPPPTMEEPPIPGQLAIPVDEVAGSHTAVIVQFDAGSRRRPPRR